MAPKTAQSFALPIWSDSAGKPLACRDKIKVLNDNLEEIRALCQDALEDAVLMGADERQVRATFEKLLASLINPYKK